MSETIVHLQQLKDRADRAVSLKLLASPNTSSKVEEGLTELATVSESCYRWREPYDAVEALRKHGEKLRDEVADPIKHLANMVTARELWAKMGAEFDRIVQQERALGVAKNPRRSR